MAIESKIIYTIGNEIITNIDIKNQFKYLSVLNDDLKNLDKEKIFNISKDSIIKEKIKKNEIKKIYKSLEVDKEYLKRVIENIYLKLQLKSLNEFNVYLNTHDLKIEDIENKVKIDALWNQLIVEKYSKKIDINIEKIKQELDNSTKLITKNFLLSEIIFEIDNKNELYKKYDEIMKSINEVGFENTVSIYSIADTAKVSGNIGWINEQSLSKKIRDNIISLKKGDISKPFILSGGVLILKINNVEEKNREVDQELELKKAISYEQNKQLEQYSKIYFNRIKKNLEFSE